MKIELDEYQDKVVNYPGEKFLCVEAGPGAGKTRVIVERVKELLKKAEPESLLVITFTVKAAEELKERLISSGISKNDVYKMQISTIHSFCLRILKDSDELDLELMDDERNEKKNMFIGKHIRDLGFVNEYYLPYSQIKDVIRKYDEYCTFNVDPDSLVQYIKDTREISIEYADFVYEYMAENNGEFPRNEVEEDEKFAKDWYNAKYLQIARSYKTYLKFLKREHVIDYGQLQIRALNYLKDNPETDFKNILVDEFQDTDPVQMNIFEILMENADSFLVVGDMNQSIYSFRGCGENFFRYIYENHSDKFIRKVLPINYRSTNEIINISDDFIRHQNEGEKLNPIGDRDASRDIYYLGNSNSNNEAENICKIAKYLYDNDKIENYNEIAVLTRSVKKATIRNLIKEFEKNGVPYVVKGRDDLIEKPEIKSILTLLFHLIRNNDPHYHITISWEKWLNLKAYTGADFEQKLFDLSDSTKRILNKIQEDFEQLVIDTRNEIDPQDKPFDDFLKASQGHDDILKELYSCVERPILTDENIIRYGITDEDDIEFFRKLNALREEILSDEIPYNDKPNILEVYMALLTDFTDYLNYDFIQDEDNYEELKNISVFTNTFYNYEQIRKSKDLRGAFWFIYSNIYSFSPYNDNSKDGVQIMTVHGAKGLEFPIVILAALDRRFFPVHFEDPSINDKVKNSPSYFTPYEFLEYKDETFDSDSERLKHDLEEERIIYVAMTRAQDVLILSTLLNKRLLKRLNFQVRKRNAEGIIKTMKGPDCINELVNRNIDKIKFLDANNPDISRRVCDVKQGNDEKVNLSFSSIESYLECPFKYGMTYDIMFKTSQEKVQSDGIFVHNVFEVVNNLNKKNNGYIGDDKVRDIVYELYMLYNFNKNDMHKLAKFSDDIVQYYNKCDFKVLDVEYKFDIKHDDYFLNGYIDLIYEKDGKLGILDYKNTFYKSYNYEKYKRQLYIYLLALIEKNQKYADYDFDELEIYAVRSQEFVQIPIDENELKKVKEELNFVSSGVTRSDYEKAVGRYCENCNYKKICGHE